MFCAGLVNTNTTGAFFLGVQPSLQTSVFMRQTNVEPEIGTYDSLILYSTVFGYSYGDQCQRPIQKRVEMFSMSGGTVQSWLDGFVNKIDYYSPAFTYNSISPATNGFNQLNIGMDCIAANNGANGNTAFYGWIAGVFIFTNATPGLASTNTAFGGYQLHQWMEPDTTYRLYLGDSEFVNGASLSLDETTTIYAHYQLRPQTANSWSWASEAAGGTGFGSYNSAGSVYRLYGLPAISKIKKEEQLIETSVNDLSTASSQGNVVYGYLTNQVFIAKTNDYRWQTTVITPCITGTGGPNSNNVPYYTNLVVSIPQYIACIYTNRSLFAGIWRRDLVVNPYLLSTNNNFSLDWQHFYGPLGYLANWAIADSYLGDGDYGLRPIPDYNGSTTNRVNWP